MPSEIFRLLLGVGLGVLIVLGGLWLFQRRLIYFPTGGVPPAPGLGWEAAVFETTDGLVLHGWFMAPPGDAPVVLVFNGNAGNRAGRAHLGVDLASGGLGVLLFDYRGYGENPGRPTAPGLAADAQAALAWVRRRVPEHQLAYFGESLGAAVAIELAESEPPAALILRSPFTSLSDLAALHYPLIPRVLLRDEFPSLDRIGNVGSPILVVAGEADSIVPIEQSRAVFEAALEPKELLVVAGADHNDAALAGGPDVVEATLRFVTRYAGAAPGE